MVNLRPFGPSRIAGAILLVFGLTACSRTILVNGGNGNGAATSNGPTASGGTAGTAGTGGGSHPATQCPSQTLASGLDVNSAIAYSNQLVYHASGAWSFGAVNSKIVRVPIGGGDPETFLASVPSVSTSHALAVNATDLYWAASDGTVRKAALDSAETTVLFTGSCAQGSTLGCPQSIALDNDNVYFGSLDGSIRRMPLNGGDPTVLVDPQSDFASAVALTLSSSNLVWVEEGESTSFIKTIPLAGGDPSVLFKGPFTLTDVASYGDYAYVTDGGPSLSDGPDGIMGTGTIYKVRIDQSEPAATLATAKPFPSGIYADATGVYWGGGLGISQPPGGGTTSVPLEHIPDNTTTVETVVPATVAYTIISCEDAICWVDAATGDLMRYAECSP